MIRQAFTLLMLLALAFTTLGCSFIGARWVRGSGHVTTEERTVSDFTRVTLAGIGHLHVEQGDQESLRIEAEDNLLPYLETEVHNGELQIGSRPGVALHPTQPLDFYVTVKTVEALTLAGSGEVTAPALHTDDLAVTLSGSGQMTVTDLQAKGTLTAEISGSGALVITGQAQAQEIILSGSGKYTGQVEEMDALTVQLTGSGAIQLAGTTQHQQVTISGSGPYQAAKLTSDDADVTIIGSGDATLQARERLAVLIGGSGEVRYLGEPTVEQKITGSGRVEKIK